MNKDEILELSRKENIDEREELIKEKSNKYIFISMTIVAAIFVVIRAIKGETIMDLPVTVCSAMAVSNFYRYKHTKRKDSLISASIFSVVAVVCLIFYCLGI